MLELVEMPSPGNLTSQGNGGGRSPTHRVAVLGQVAGQVAEVSMSMSPKWGRCGLGRGLQLGADPKTREQRGQGRGVREGPVGSLSTLTCSHLLLKSSCISRHWMGLSWDFYT